jgi:hypothetical protein
MKKIIAVIILAVVASVCGAQETVAPSVETVPAVEHIYACPVGYAAKYFVKEIPLITTAEIGSTGNWADAYQDHYIDAPSRDIIRNDPPVCVQKKKAVKPALPDPDKAKLPFVLDNGVYSGYLPTAITISSLRTYRVVIYSHDKSLMEFFDDKGAAAFTVFTDGTVKDEKGEEVDATTKAFWKNLADAFVGWKESACKEGTK